MLAVETPVKINLMCGHKLWPGFINVDGAEVCFGKKPDVVSDARSLPFPDNYADEIHCIHGIEHFYIWETPDLLREWRRVLKPDGLLVIECPDIEKILDMWANGKTGMAKTWFGLYGDQTLKNEGMVHRWCYCFAQLRTLLIDLGFKNVEKLNAQFHMPIRDMRVESRKGDPLRSEFYNVDDE